ncbi:enoyl-CoA hydratase/isomerase family protein [Mycolicibacterium goodii]|uniref:enoyl-CoA hydratase/isomerase family protein n=1 Tax=Mycolicibacterium goodii TaxID=134601 RepID=UPI001BDD3DB6|nr:enoyl-CoA hydratase/isomerase family protein [Mycolicibacterium goodii]MBU8819662.1 enoyl-CoA hydratase/isomerase family protein [Mycolicibacterium goodii]MBU8833967.1 enoyl-CoA hydratase/isomerase family protein [Mycolicibacterium goodii]
MTATIDRTDRGPVRILTINNPEKRNAFSAGMAPALRTLLLEADRDPAVRAIVITGGASVFSSGHDLQEVLENPETAGDPEANAAFTLPAELGTPVIAAVNGAAYAAGFILALNCDLRIAGSNARFCAVGARIGLVPVGGQLSRLLNVVSYPAAFTMLSTASPVTAKAARDCGFVNEICDPADTLERAIGLAEEISEVSPAVVRAIKTGLRTTLTHGMAAGNALEPALAAVVRELPDGDEGVRSFLEKRPPQYPDAPLDLQDKLDKAGTPR